MKTIRLFSLSVFLVTIISLPGCSMFRNPTEPESRSNDLPPELSLNAESCRIHYWQDVTGIGYENGGLCNVERLFGLWVQPRSMSSEQYTRITTEVTMTSSGALIFHFEPSGLQFNPTATLILNYRRLEEEFDLTFSESRPAHLRLWNPRTNQWELKSTLNTSQNSDYRWNNQDKYVTFSIPHFSIWAISKD